jgi:hypothetical protein
MWRDMRFMHRKRHVFTYLGLQAGVESAHRFQARESVDAGVSVRQGSSDPRGTGSSGRGEGAVSHVPRRLYRAAADRQRGLPSQQPGCSSASGLVSTRGGLFAERLPFPVLPGEGAVVPKGGALRAASVARQLRRRQRRRGLFGVRRARSARALQVRLAIRSFDVIGGFAERRLATADARRTVRPNP